MGENSFKQCNRQGLNLQNIQKTHTTQQQKTHTTQQQKFSRFENSGQTLYSCGLGIPALPQMQDLEQVL